MPEMEYTINSQMVKVVIDECPTPDTVTTHIYVLNRTDISEAINDAVTDFRSIYTDAVIKYICAEYVDSVRIL